MDLTIIQKLEEELNSHLERYRELIDFLEKEKRYLINMDLDGLLRLSRLKEELAKKIMAGEPSFRDSLSMAGAMLGLKSEKPTLAEVAKGCPLPFSNRLADGAITLAGLKNRILRENEQAKRFVEESLDLVTESINILSGANQLKGESYASDGKKEKGVKKALPAKLSRDV
ncbi:MAG: flagellar protein FlgN [Deltaproteobacteria bacterium]|jgi:hypothetical protein|nr:flagellar protein FlgN [Deltaproteobacteria bacterium]